MARQSLPVVPTWYIDFTAYIASRTEPLKSYKDEPALVEIYQKVRDEVLTYVEMMRTRVKIPDYELFEPFRTQILNAILQYPTVRIDKSTMFVELPEGGALRIRDAFPLLVISRAPLPVLLGNGQKPQEDAGLLGQPAVGPAATNLPDGWVSMQGGGPAPVSEASLLAALQQGASGDPNHTPPAVAVISSAAVPPKVITPRKSPIESLAALDAIPTDVPGWVKRTGVHTHPTGTFIISEEDGLATCTWMFSEIDEPETVAAGVRLTRMGSAVAEFLVGLAARVDAFKNPPAAESGEEFEVVVDLVEASDVDVDAAYAEQAAQGPALLAQVEVADPITAGVEVKIPEAAPVLPDPPAAVPTKPKRTRKAKE